MTKPVYQFGGALPLEAIYIQRPADEELYSALKNREFCYVLNSRQMGKSSLRVRVGLRLKEEGFCCAHIDISTLPTTDESGEKWYAVIISRIAKELELSFNLKDFYAEYATLPPTEKFDLFVINYLLPLQKPVIIFIDEIDSILSLSAKGKEDFFALIRSYFNRRAENSAYNWLTFAIFGVATPSDLISDKTRTPFNVGHGIELTGLALPDALPLADGFKDKVENAQQALAAILAWTGGQPFLTHKLCALVVQKLDKALPLPAFIAWLEGLVRSSITEQWESHDEPEHLRTIRDRLLVGKDNKEELLGIYQQILRNGSVAADNSSAQMMLCLTGLVVKRDSVLRVNNRIYAEVFNQYWVTQELAKLCPYSASLTAWFNSGKKDASLLLRGQALLDALHWARGKNLPADDEFLDTCLVEQLIKKRILTVTLKIRIICTELELFGIDPLMKCISDIDKEDKVSLKMRAFDMCYLEYVRYKNSAISEYKNELIEIESQDKNNVPIMRRIKEILHFLDEADEEHLRLFHKSEDIKEMKELWISVIHLESIIARLITLCDCLMKECIEYI